ncbi:hypothetical protein LB505_007702 [Fusarium chuoi]|nr:hypothetical protein LB505_007702 [Fusarium chuoi]
MGCGMSTEEKEGKARNEEIENQLKRDKMMQRNEIKMLLLVNHPQADEAHSRGWLFARRAGILQGNHLQQHRSVNACYPRGYGVSRASA